MDKSHITSGPSFQDFIKGASVKKSPGGDEDVEISDEHSYLPEVLEMGNSRKG